ncbi:MAG: site-specific integrase, partial [Tannerella sp.]|nr:site-specific integrase [Tannerella sp.]
MARRKKELVMPHLNNCGGDLSKMWYVEYSIRNPQSGEMERVRHYDGINQCSTYEERLAEAQKVIEYYTRQIQAGSVSYQKFSEYEDLLLYDGQAAFSKKRTAPAGHIKMYLSEFLRIKSLEINVNSIRSYTSQLRLFYLYAEEKSITNKPATYYTQEIIIDFLRSLAAKGLSRITIRKYEELLHNFFEYLKTKKIIQENPVCDIPKLGKVKDEAPAAIPDYMRRLLRKEIEPNDPQLWM